MLLRQSGHPACRDAREGREAGRGDATLGFANSLQAGGRFGQGVRVTGADGPPSDLFLTPRLARVFLSSVYRIVSVHSGGRDGQCQTRPCTLPQMSYITINRIRSLRNTISGTRSCKC